MSDKIKFYSEIERYEIVNFNDGEKYDNLLNNDMIIDEAGNMKALVLNQGRARFSFFSKNDFLEVPWEYVKKIGTRTIIIDIDESSMKKINV